MRVVQRAFVLGALGLAVACNGVFGIEQAEYDPTFNPDGGSGEALCSDTCQYSGDGACDDGGPNSSYSVCELGTDCTDCGPRGGSVGSTDPAVVGTACTDGTQCSAIASGYCATAGVCTRECSSHDDCGCPAGTLNPDIVAGLCAANCITYSDGSGYCYRTCTSDAECAAGTFCDQGTDYRFCTTYRSEVGYSCPYDQACSRITGGFCHPNTRLCTAPCSSDADCGCVDGTTCEFACAPDSFQGGVLCQRVCTSDADCYGASSCQSVGSYSVCVRSNTVGSPCMADYQCDAAAGICGADGTCSSG
jgi:hypothetical protein